jgi:hypothetical protein
VLGGEDPDTGLDCQGAVEWMLRQLGIEANYSGTNDMWRHMFSQKGTIAEGVSALGEIPIGAAILIVDHDGGEPAKYQGDGEGNCWHIYLKIEDNLLLHASASNGKVTTRSFADEAINGGPSHYGLIEGVYYEGISGGASTDEPTEQDYVVTWVGFVYADNGLPVKLRPTASADKPYLAKIKVGETVDVLSTLSSGWLKVKYAGQTGYIMGKFVVTELPDGWEAVASGSWDPQYDSMTFEMGCAGDGVREIQTGLNRLGYSLDVDGDFGPATDDAVRKFQEANDLEIDGQVGPITWRALIRAVAGK